MSKQKITYPDYGSRSMRVLEALTPLTGAAAPVKHADFIGQIYVETTTPALYVAVATDSEEAANDWSLSTIEAVPAAVAAAIAEANIPGQIELIAEALTPLTGAAAPVEHASFIGQIYVETTSPALYVAVATDSDEAANDWALSTIAALPAAVSAAILEANIPGQIALAAAEFEPLTGLVSPDMHADFIGQIYVDTVAGKGYMAIATDSAAAADDWKEITLELESLTPLTGAAAPVKHADFIGQIYVDTVAGKGYMAIATDSAAAADDWKEITSTEG